MSKSNILNSSIFLNMLPDSGGQAERCLEDIAGQT